VDDVTMMARLESGDEVGAAADLTIRLGSKSLRADSLWTLVSITVASSFDSSTAAWRVVNPRRQPIQFLDRLRA